MLNPDERLVIDLVIPALRASSLRQAYQGLARQVAKETGVPAVPLFDQLMEREKQATSGTGDGVALPHLRLATVTRPFFAFARLTQPVDFKAVDGRPVDLVGFMLSPEEDGPLHLRRLSHVSRLLRNGRLLTDLRAASDAAVIYALFLHSGQKLRSAA